MTNTNIKIRTLGFLAIMTGGLCGCGQAIEMSGKGGTELPNPLQVVYILPGGSNTSTDLNVAGVQWRVWETSGTDLLSRGTAISDSQGQITLPNQNGVWVLEGWRSKKPSQVPVKVTMNRAIPDSCLDSVASGQGVLPSHKCLELTAPSQESATVAPTMLSVVRLSNGLAPVHMKMLNPSGNLQAQLVRARLWRLGSSDSLRFEGELSIDASGDVLMPRPLENSSYLLEAWQGSGTVAGFVNEAVPFSAAFPSSFSSYVDCLEMPVLPASGGTFSVHACDGLGAAPSLVGHAGTTPDLWGTFKLVP
jgi:hypothetical protein